MKQCLSEEALWQLYEGGGSREERAHLVRCQVCTIRSARLAKELTLLGQVLREAPPQTVQAQRYRRPTRGWMPFALAGAIVVLLFWRSLPFSEWPSVSLSLSTTATPSREAAQGVEEEELAHFFAHTVGPAIFATTDFGTTSVPKQATSLSYLQAALNGGWPSERCEGNRTHACKSDPLALLLDEDEG